MNIVGMIPARMASSRFPGKPLAEIHGIPMLGHVFYRSKMSKILDEVYVATCDEQIINYINSIGGIGIITKDTHERASDRCAEAMLKVEKKTGRKIDILVMIQGDEPLVNPDIIEEAVKPLMGDSSFKVVNLMAKIRTIEEFEDPNEVKVVVNQKNQALYFSREPIPSRKKGYFNVPMLKQVCIIPFLRDYLLEFNSMGTTPLEEIESIDMMRILEHGGIVQMVMIDTETVSVDTPKDLERVTKMMETDTLRKQYS